MHHLLLPSLLQTYTPAPQRSTQKGRKLLGQLQGRTGDKKFDGTRTVPRGQSSLAPRTWAHPGDGHPGQGRMEGRYPPPQSTPPASSTTTERCPRGCPMKPERHRGGWGLRREDRKRSREDLREIAAFTPALSPQAPLPALGQRSDRDKALVLTSRHLPSIPFMSPPGETEAHSHKALLPQPLR